LAGPRDPALRGPVLRALTVVDWLARLDGWFGALCLLLLCVLMISGIVVRTLSTVVDWLPKDIPVAWEYSSYLMAVTFTFGAALTLRAGGHIRVKVLLGAAGPRASMLLEMVSTLIGTVFAGFFFFAMSEFAWRAFRTDDRSLASDTPLWIPQACVAFGALLLVLQLVARLGQLALGETPENKDIIR
jgi:TRAP-type C4-dicarboxylate transport system permease small subunit